MASALFDTSILIGHLRGLAGFRELFHSLALKGEIAVSTMTIFEVVQGMRETERKMTFELLHSLRVYPVDEPIAELAGEWVRLWKAKGRHLKGPDALIAATACHHQCDLVTTNLKDFPMPEIRVFTLDEMGNLLEEGRG